MPKDLVFITVIGKDQKGIIAHISNAVFKHNINIEDLNQKVMETVRMTLYHNFDIRTVTLGINLKDCIDPDIESFKSNVYNKVTEYGKRLVNEAGKIEDKYGIPIVNKRISVTPVSLIVESCKEDAPLEIAKTLDMAGAFHGIGEPDFSLNIGISGPGVVRSVVEKNRECDLTGLSEVIKRTAFKITRS